MLPPVCSPVPLVMGSGSQLRAGSTSPVGPGVRLNHRIGLTAEPVHRSVEYLGGDHLDDGAADLDLVALLQALRGEHPAPVEPRAVRRAEVLDVPGTVRELEPGVVVGGVVIAHRQVALAARGEVGAEDVGLASGLDDERRGGPEVGQGGLAVAVDGGYGGPPGFLLGVGDVVPPRDGALLGPAVGVVRDPSEGFEVNAWHPSSLPEVAGWVVRTAVRLGGSRPALAGFA